MLKGSPAYDKIIETFGNGILNKEEIDRKKLGAIVFDDAEKLKILSAINHKYVIKESLRQIDFIKNNPSGFKFIVIDAPLLVEAGMHEYCDIICVVKADLDIRLGRILLRDGLSEEQAVKRIESRQNAEEMEKHAHIVISNNSGIKELENEIAELLESI